MRAGEGPDRVAIGGGDRTDRRPLVAALRSVADLWPTEVRADAERDRALAFLGTDVRSETVVRACYAGGTLGTVVAVLAALALPSPWSIAVAAPIGLLALATLLAGPAAPGLLASARRTRSLGAAPALVGRAAISMRLAPSPERAARFAATASDGPLGRSLTAHVRRTANGPRSAFRSFAGEWAPWFPALERSLSLIESAAEDRPERRRETLERARAVVHDAARDRTAAYAAGVRGPATAVYAFGVLVPLALVSLVPAIRATGAPASVALLAVVYDVVLPVGLLAASAWLLGRRPIAFPPPAVDRDHPSVPSARWPAALAGVVAALVGVSAAVVVLPRWTAPIAAVGGLAGASLVVRYYPARRVRAEARAVEEGLPDAMDVVGGRVGRGASVEATVARVAPDVDGPVGDVLAAAAGRQRRLGVDLETALLGEDGVLSTVPSPRTRDCARLLALAAEHGAPAGEAVADAGEHLAELQRVEREARRAVERVSSTLANTAAVFAPLVGGATVALADAMGSRGPSPRVRASDAGGLASAGGVDGLGLVVGVYVLLLAAILTALATGLSRGFDRALVGYRVGLALLAATATYLAAVAGTGLLV